MPLKFSATLEILHVIQHVFVVLVNNTSHSHKQLINSNINKCIIYH